MRTTTLHRRTLWGIILICMASASCSTGNATGTSRPEGKPLPRFEVWVSDSIVFEIDPRLELLAGVQSHTSWVEGHRGPGDSPSTYYTELSGFFESYKNHPAMAASQSLTRWGFTYDAPPALLISSSRDSALSPPVQGWSEYLKGRAGFFFGRSRLDSFVLQLSKLYSSSSFESFLKQQEAYYKGVLADLSSSYDWQRMSVWMEGFYQNPAVPITYHYTLAPAMFPGGGYGPSVMEYDAAGNITRLHVYQVIRSGQGTAGDGGLPLFPKGPSLAMLGLHEFGHSYVNPCLKNLVHLPENKQALERLFTPVKTLMRKQAYPDMAVFMNELVIRAITIIGAEELGLSDPIISRFRADDEVANGFYPIDFVIHSIRELRKANGVPRRFEDYAPQLVQALVEETPRLVTEYQSANSQKTGKLDPVDNLSLALSFLPPDTDIESLFDISLGAQSQGGTQKSSQLRLNSDNTKGKGLVLSANGDTSYWLYLSRPVAVKTGRLSLSYKARGSSIHTEEGQYGGSYAGFIITDKAGKRQFKVLTHTGSFDWQLFSIEETIDPAKVASIELALFLNESGELAFDALELSYLP